MNTKSLFLLVFCLGLLACSEDTVKSPVLADFDKIIGKWTSVSNDTYEVWERVDNKLIGDTYRLINDTLKLVNNAEIRIEDSVCIFEMDISNPDKKNRVYQAVWVDSLNDYIFQNESVFPKFLAYLSHPNSDNLIVLAGESFEKKDYFEFLYQKVDSLPK